MTTDLVRRLRDVGRDPGTHQQNYMGDLLVEAADMIERLSAPAPDAATLDQIMALADAIDRVEDFTPHDPMRKVNRERKEKARAALRAAIEQLQKDAFDKGWDGGMKAAEPERDFWKERAERAEQKVESATLSISVLQGLLLRAEAAHQIVSEQRNKLVTEREALRALLVEAQDCVVYKLCGTNHEPIRELLARIDEAIAAAKPHPSLD